MQTNFISKYQGLILFDEPDKETKEAEQLAQFVPIGNKKGGFSTDDPLIIKKLLERKDHGKTFSVLKDKMPKFEDGHIVRGAATSIDKSVEIIKKNLEAEKEIEIDKAKIELGKKYRRFGKLEASLLNKDGGFRKDATKELQEEYLKLKEEIGE